MYAVLCTRLLVVFLVRQSQNNTVFLFYEAFDVLAFYKLFTNAIQDQFKFSYKSYACGMWLKW